MALPAVAGLLVNFGFGAIYCKISPKFSLLSKILLKPQMKAFALSAAVQGVFTYRVSPQDDGRFFIKKSLSTYLLMSGSIYFFHRQVSKANAMSSFILGTSQLIVGELAPVLISRIPPPEDKMDLLPKDHLMGVLDFFDAADIISAARTCKSFRAAVNTPVVQKTLVQRFIFGPADWNRYFGDVGEVPPLPQNLTEILNAPCPYNPGKIVGNTHMLVLIPATVDGKPFTLNLLEVLTKEGAQLTIDCWLDQENKGPAKSYWILMTRDVIPNSRSKSYDEQKALVKANESYELPNTLEAATSIMMHFFKTGKRLYGHDSLTFTRCKDKAVVGGFSHGGFSVASDFFSISISDGAAAVRKF